MNLKDVSSASKVPIQDASWWMRMTILSVTGCNITVNLMEKIESKNLLHGTFGVFLFNSKYELLLQQCSATKSMFTLVWTNTCCSHPLFRESELHGATNAARGKLLDEVGIPAEDVPVDEFIPLGLMLYKAPSDGKWVEEERDSFLPFDSSSPFIGNFR